MMNNKKIFISICSYRDNDIYNTIHSLFDNAFYFENIFICVYIQEKYPFLLKHYLKINKKYHKYINIETIYYKYAKGPLYARQYIIKNLIKKKYDYYLQIDSHMRFIKNWDLLLLNDYHNKFYPKKKIISYYPLHSFKDNTNIPVLIEKSKIHNNRIDKYKTRFINSNIINNYFDSKYIAAGFFFTEMKFILQYYPLKEIPYLFQGEEMLLTYYFKKQNNFIIFSPTNNIASHKYNRENEHKVWNDIHNWKILNNQAIEILNKMIF